MRISPVLVGPPVPLPILLRAVRAGFPSPADDHLDRGIDLNEILIRNRPATFLVRVDGDSMKEKGLADGDLAVVDRSVRPTNGDVVVVDVDGDRSFKVWARPATAGFERSRAAWDTKFEMRSPRYTTRLDELPRVAAR